MFNKMYSNTKGNSQREEMAECEPKNGLENSSTSSEWFSFYRYDINK